MGHEIRRMDVCCLNANYMFTTIVQQHLRYFVLKVSETHANGALPLRMS